jgi:hypothetical protein
MPSSCSVYTSDIIQKEYETLQRKNRHDRIYLSDVQRSLNERYPNGGCMGNDKVLQIIDRQLREDDRLNKTDIITDILDTDKSKTNFKYTLIECKDEIAEAVQQEFQAQNNPKEKAQLKAVYEAWMGIGNSSQVADEYIKNSKEGIEDSKKVVEEFGNGTFDGAQMKKTLLEQLQKDINSENEKVKPNEREQWVQNIPKREQAINNTVDKYKNNMYNLTKIKIPDDDNEMDLEVDAVTTIFGEIYSKIDRCLIEIDYHINQLIRDDYFEKLDHMDLKNEDRKKFEETYNTVYTDTNTKIGLIKKINTVLESLKKHAELNSNDVLKKIIGDEIQKCNDTITTVEGYKKDIEENAEKNGVKLKTGNSMTSMFSKAKGFFSRKKATTQAAGKRKQRRTKTNKLRTHNNNKRTKHSRKVKRTTNKNNRVKHSRKAKKARKSRNARKTRKH